MKRFRTEYLGQLQLHANKSEPYELTVNEIVLVGSEGLKKIKAAFSTCCGINKR